MAQSSFDILNVRKELPIFTVELPTDGVLQDLIVNYRKNNPEGTKSNVKAWRSDWYTHKKDPQFKYFVDLVSNACDFICHNHFNVKPDVVLTCSNMWIAQYDVGDYAQNHDHFPDTLSCVYFVEVEDNCAPLIFEDTLEIQPKNGLLVIFPSIVRHKVDPTQGPRTVISMNFRQSM